MNDQFKVGTICIGQNFMRNPELNDAEGVIVGALLDYVGDGILEYIVDWSNGALGTLCIPRNLRRKPPKQSDSQWADEAVRKLKKQSSDHVVIGKPELIPEETA